MSRIDSHIAAVRRRLTFALYLEWLAMAAFVLGALALLVILSDRFLQLAPPARSIWVGVGLVVAVAALMSILRAPSTAHAAVAIDEKLDLKEKFSTALAVRGSCDPFAQATVLDAEQTAMKVNLAGRFPLSFPRAGYYAIGMAGLALLSLMLPRFDLLGREARQKQQQQQVARLAESTQTVREALSRIEQLPLAVQQSEKVQVGRKQLEDFLKHPTADPESAARRSIDALSRADEAMRSHIAQNKDYAEAQQTKNLLQSMNNPPIDADGPVSKAQRDMMDGNLKESLEELKKLSEKFNELSEKDKEKAAEQMKQLAQNLQQMAKDPRAMQKLQNQLQQMGVNQQQIQKAQQLTQQAANGNQQAQQQLQQMQQQMQQQLQQAAAKQGMTQQQVQQMQQQMAQAMQGAQQAANAQAQANQMAQGAQQMAQGMQQMAQQGQQPGQGQPGQAGQQMAQGMQQLQQQLEQMQQMQQDLQNAQNAQQGLKDAMAQAGGQCNGNGQGQGQGQGKGQGQGQWKPGDPQANQGGGQGGPGIGAGGQGEKAFSPFGVKKEVSRSKFDKSGQVLASVFIKDRSVRGDAKLQLKQAIEAGQANEGGDVDESRADRRSQEVQKRYFQVLNEAAAK